MELMVKNKYLSLLLLSNLSESELSELDYTQSEVSNPIWVLHQVNKWIIGHFQLFFLFDICIAWNCDTY